MLRRLEELQEMQFAMMEAAMREQQEEAQQHRRQISDFHRMQTLGETNAAALALDAAELAARKREFERKQARQLQAMEEAMRAAKQDAAQQTMVGLLPTRTRHHGNAHGNDGNPKANANANAKPKPKPKPKPMPMPNAMASDLGAENRGATDASNDKNGNGNGNDNDEVDPMEELKSIADWLGNWHPVLVGSANANVSASAAAAAAHDAGGGMQLDLDAGSLRVVDVNGVWHVFVQGRNTQIADFLLSRVRACVCDVGCRHVWFAIGVVTFGLPSVSVICHGQWRLHWNGFCLAVALAWMVWRVWDIDLILAHATFFLC